jgi:ferric-dicitrate binding protein FerR (iron transport regulator)
MQLVLPPLPLLRRLSCAFFRVRAGSIRLSRELSPRETVRISPVRQLQVSCCEGTVWVTTGTNDEGDVVLVCGQRLAVAAGASVVIEGLQASRIEVSAY